MAGLLPTLLVPTHILAWRASCDHHIPAVLRQRYAALPPEFGHKLR